MKLYVGQTIRVRRKGFLTHHQLVVMAGVLLSLEFIIGFFRWGSSILEPIPMLIVSVGPSIPLVVALVAWNSYATSITVFPERIRLNRVLGTKEIRFEDIGRPTHVEGSFVWFGTSNDAPGYWGTVLRVNGEVARLILESPFHPPTSVPESLAHRIATLQS